MNKSFKTVMHFLVAAHYIYAIQYDFRYVKIPVDKHRMGSEFGGKLKYLTVIDAIIQATYFTICFINDLIGSNDVAPKSRPLIRKIKDNLFATLAFPCALNVSTTFWALMSIDRELVFPKILDLYFPMWLNHVVHTNIFIFIMIEMFTTFRQYPSRKFGLTILSVFMLAYMIWLHIVKHYSGFWVYPVLDVFALPQRIMFFVVMFIFSCGLYLLGEFLNKMRWGRDLKSITSGKKNKKI